MAQIATGNDLVSGRVIYLKPDGGWSERIAESRVGESEEESKRLLADAEQSALRQEVVEPYLIDVERVGTRILPLRYRESIRAKGPTVWNEPGKGQSERN